MDELQGLGYTHAEISTALSWLVDRLEFSEKFALPKEFGGSTAHRVFHRAEREILTLDAYGELIQMQQLGLITNEQTEMLIEKASLMGANSVDVHQLRYFVANAVFGAQVNSLPAHRFMLTGSDSIN
jgi:uncharacterized protein Smg (DUF494 family)